jgi:quinol monooxygenase YgiN
MDGSVSWLVELAVRPGALDAFRALTDEMVAAAAEEPGTRIYERFVSTDGSVVHGFERFDSPAAALAHLERFGESFAERFLALVERRRITAYGAVSDGLRKVLDPMGADYLQRLDGLAR